MTRSLLLRLSLVAALAATTSQPLGAALTFHVSPETSSGRVAIQNRRGAEHTEEVSRTFTTSGAAALDLSNIAGRIEVTGGTGSAIRIDAVKRVRHQDAAEGRRLLSALRVEMSQVGNRVEVRTEYPRGERRFSGQVDYTVTVPASAAVAIKSISGEVILTGISGETRADSVSGDVVVSRCPQLAHARTVSGDVRVSDVASDAALTLGSVSGSVIARDVKVRSLEAGVVSGDVDVSGVTAERIQAKTVSGMIEFGGRLARGGRYEFNAHSGDVRLALSGETGFELTADSFSGSIRSDFPLTLRSAGDERQSRRGVVRTIRGTFGDASAVITARSFSGSIVLTRR